MQTPEVIKFAKGLTLTLEGPQGCGKSLMGDWIRFCLPANIAHTTGSVVSRSGSFQTEAPVPTFDEWYAARHNGSTFEHDHMQDGAWIASALKTLAQLMREYITEIARGSQHG